MHLNVGWLWFLVFGHSRKLNHLLLGLGNNISESVQSEELSNEISVEEADNLFSNTGQFHQILIDNICNGYLSLGRRDLDNLQQTCKYFDYMIKAHIIRKYPILLKNFKELLSSNQIITGRLFEEQAGFLQTLRLLIAMNSNEVIKQISGKMGDPETYGFVGQILAEQSDPDDIYGTFIVPVSIIMNGLNKFCLANSTYQKTWMVARVRRLLSNPIPVRKQDGSICYTADGLGLLFNSVIEGIARKLDKMIVYKLIVKNYRMGKIEYDWVLPLISVDFMIKLWNLEHYQYLLRLEMEAGNFRPLKSSQGSQH